MHASPRRLGRGLDSLVSSIPDHEQRPPVPDEDDTNSQELADAQMRSVAIDGLRPNPFQPRHKISAEEIASLADSIAVNGLLQPIVARRRQDHYEIIAGERRWHAAKAAGMTSVPVLIKEASEQEMLELALVENIQREDLNAIDRAMAYRQFCDEFGVTAPQVAQRLGEDRSTVVNYLRLLELPDSVKNLVASRQLSMGHARCILGVDGPKAREDLAQRILLDQLSVRATERLVRGMRDHPPHSPDASGSPKRKLPVVADMERRLEAALKTRVTIVEGAAPGKGRIVIDYFSLDDFERLAALMGVMLDENGP